MTEAKKNLLIIDDDRIFCEALSSGMAKRGYDVIIAHNSDDALVKANHSNPELIITDLKMPGGSGLELIPKLLEIDPNCLILVLTGYASVNTAIEAIKLGAVHYLSKPVSIDDIISAFEKLEGDPKIRIDEGASLNKTEWGHILKVMERNNNNISASARELGLHRRTLQRKLDKIPARYYK